MDHWPLHRSLLYCEMEPSLWPGLATLLRGKRLRQTHGRLLLSMCQQHRQASVGGITSLYCEGKGTEKPRLHNTAWKQELNTCTKIWADFPTHLETALSKMPWTLRSNSHTSDTGITPPSELCREERVLIRATLRWEMNCSVSRVAWEAVPTPVCKSERDWSAFLLADFKVMLPGGVEDLNPNAAGCLDK